MKEPTPTKKELAEQYRALDEQIRRLKSRLNGEVFKKTKHGYRLDQLSEGARELQGRIEQMEAHIRNLAEQDAALLRETASLREKSGGKKRIKAMIGQLGADVEGLHHQQQQLRQTLKQGGQLATQIADLRDDLRRESDDLKAQVRNLEESSSRESIAQAAQLDRIQSLETELAELTHAQQRLGDAAKAEQASLQRELDDALLPMQAALQRIEQQSAGDGTRLDEIEQQLGAIQREQLAIGDLAEQLQRQHPLEERLHSLEGERESLKVELDTLKERQQQIFEQQQADQANAERRIQDALVPLQAALQQDIDARIGELESRSQELHAQALELERSRQEQFAEQHTRDASRKALDDTIDSLQSELRRIDEQRAQERDRLGGFEQQLAALRDAIDTPRPPSGQLSAIESLQQELQRRLEHLEQRDPSPQVGQIEERVQQLTQSWNPEFGNRLTGLEAELGRLNEAEEFLQESYRGLGGMELALTGRLDALQRGLEQQRGSAEALELRLDQLGEALERNGQQLRAELEEARKAGAEPQARLTGNLDRLEQAADVDRERISQLETSLASVRDDTEQWQREIDEKLDANASIADDYARLESEISQQKQQQQAQTELSDQQTGQLSALSEQLLSHRQKEGELTEAQRNLAALVEQQDEEQQALQAKLQDQESLLQQVRSWTDEQNELQQQISAAVQASKSGLDELQDLGLKSNERVVGLEQAQQLLKQQQESDAPLLEEHTRTLQLVEERLESIGGSQEKQQRRIDKQDARGRSGRIALAALLLLGALGGVAVYLSSAAKIAESEQRMTRQMLTPDPRYATSERLTDSLRSVELAQGEIERRIDKLQSDAPPTKLWERQGDLEQRLARLEVRLNLVSVAAEPAQTIDPELLKIQRDIEGLHAQVSSGSGVSAESANAIGTLSSRMDELSEAIDERFNRLELAQRQVARSGADSPADEAQIRARIGSLETASADAMQMQKLLNDQVDEITRALSALEQRVADGNLTPATRWRNAGERRRYTIQLAGARTLDSLRQFARKQLPPGEHAFYLTHHRGSDWNILLYGIFNGVGEARAALNALPKELRRYKPWIRVVPGDYTYID
jgi:chromosome segregation ATPase